MNGFENTIDILGDLEFRKQYFGKTLTEYSDDSVLYLRGNALRSFPSLSKVTLPNCSYIGESAFYGCKNLSFISIPNARSFYYSDYGGTGTGLFEGTGVSSLELLPSYFSTVIPSYCFKDCNFTGTLTIPENYRSISAYAFANNPIERLVIDHECLIQGRAYNKCTSLKEVSAPLVKTAYASAFYSCYSLETIFMPELTGIAYYTFGYCSALKNVNDFPNVSTVFEGAFYGCENLPSLSFRIASSIAGYAFNGCKELSVIYIGSDTCNLYASTVFSSTKITFATGSIYVPASRVDYYRNSTNWNWFSTQIFGYDYENDRPVD